MAPISTLHAAAQNVQNLVKANPFPGIRTQWQNPSDLFSILLIVGGDIIQRAIAQLCSHYYITPVAFSFGWVAYTVSAITSAIGDGKFMPETDCPATLINVKSGYSRENNSWILGRILRDWDEGELKKDGKDYALVISMCTQSAAEAGRPAIDFVWQLGVLTIIAQIVLSIIPGVKSGEWTVLVITVGGTLLCLAQSALPQWDKEKFKCRKVSKKPQQIALTRGNGHNHVVFVETEVEGLNLEDLAVGRVDKHHSTLPLTLAYSVCWFVLLLTAIGVDTYTWYLLLIGSIGMVQNIFAAGFKRKPCAFGIHLKQYATIKPAAAGDSPENKVFKVIQQAEEQIPGLGLSLMPIFFPGTLFPAEQDWMGKAIAKNKPSKKKDGEKQEIDVDIHAIAAAQATDVAPQQVNPEIKTI